MPSAPPKAFLPKSAATYKRESRDELSAARFASSASLTDNIRGLFSRGLA
jgi:hypothetical protein